MSEQRRVALRGNSWMIPVPRAIRRHLGVLRGGDLYWHVGPKGEAFVTTGAHRIGGKPPGARLERDLAAALAHVERLERQLTVRPTAVLNEGIAQGWAQALRHAGLGPVWASRIEARLDEIAARLPFHRRPRARATPAAAPVEVIPVPALDAEPSS